MSLQVVSGVKEFRECLERDVGWLKSINKVNFIANGKRSNIIASQVAVKNW